MFCWKAFYNIVVVPMLWIAFHILGLYDKKAANALKGRKGLLEIVQQELAQLKPGGNRVWFHASSMGEFEQAKPIIAELKKRYPEIQIIVTFFSSSGYENSKRF